MKCSLGECNLNSEIIRISRHLRNFQNVNVYESLGNKIFEIRAGANNAGSLMAMIINYRRTISHSPSGTPRAVLSDTVATSYVWLLKFKWKLSEVKN